VKFSLPRFLPLIAAPILFLAASGGQVFAQNAALRGNVVIDGSSTVYPVTEAAASDFGKEFTNVNVTVAISGTGGGFKRFTRGETDISNASRPIRPDEFQSAKENGVRFIELPVALDGLSIVVNPENDWADKLTVDQLKAIYLEDGSARKWSDLNPEWPDQPVKVYTPGTDSGTFDYFKEVVVPEGKSFRSDMSASEDDNVLVTGVSGDRYSIGYFGAAYYFENQDKLKAVPVVNPKDGEAYLPEPQNVIDGTYYPMSRPLFIYVNVESLRKPQVRKFVEYYLENNAELAEKAQYVPIPDDVAARAKDFLRRRVTGTAYVTPEMHKREGGLRSVYTEENILDTK